MLNVQSNADTGVVVGNNDNKQNPYAEHRRMIVAFGTLALGYLIWFAIELILDGTASNWSFYLPGLMAIVGLQVVVLAVLLLSAVQYFWKSPSNGKVLYFAIPSLGTVATVGFLIFYVPLQSSFLAWLVRWVPWGALSLAAFCAPCCCQRSQRPPDNNEPLQAVPVEVEAPVEQPVFTVY